MKTNEYKAVELTDEQLAKVVGGYADGGECPMGLEVPSMAVCPYNGCIAYTTSYVKSGIPWCDYFYQEVT